LRAEIRWSVSSRIRAISALDHSRMAATSSSARRRRSAASVADRSWIASMLALASAWIRPMASSRADSAAACMAFVRSAMNLFGRFAGAAGEAGATGEADAGASLTGVSGA
jgi:hypothetical protein